eukprot:1184456-Prorocentrum_lima.AAC.1
MRAPPTWLFSGHSEAESCVFGHETHALEAPTPCSWNMRRILRYRDGCCFVMAARRIRLSQRKAPETVFYGLLQWAGDK